MAIIPVQPERRLNLVDLMVLIVATAIGLALFKFSNRPPPQGGLLRNAPLFQAIRAGIGYASPVLIAATVGCAVIRLRRPRPLLEEVADQPGGIAIVSAALVLAIGYTWMVAQLAMGTHPGFVLDPAAANQSIFPGFAIAGSWTALLIRGRWRFTRSWVEALGIALGSGWLVLLMVWYASWGILR